MLHVLLFHTPVYGGENQVGKLKRIIVDNGVANQVTVDPGLLSIERVCRSTIYARQYQRRCNLMSRMMHGSRMLPSSSTVHHRSRARWPDLAALTPQPEVVAGTVDTSRPANISSTIGPERTVTMGAVVLSEHTAVEDERKIQYRLRGLLVDDGRPLQLLLGDGLEVPFKAVSLLDAEQIRVRSSDFHAGTEA